MECVDARRAVWGGEAERADVRTHVQGCSACAVESRRAARLAVTLAGMREDLAPVPAGLYPALVASIPRSPADRARKLVTHPRFWRGAAVGAAAATMAAFGVVAARRMLRPGIAG